jgi:hypothetical protein
MKAACLLLSFALFPPVLSNLQVHAQTGVGKLTPAAAYGRLPLSFEPNLGQTDSRVKFLSRGKGYALFLTPTEAVLSLAGGGSNKLQPSRANVLRMRLPAANPNPQVTGLGELPGKVNYFLGNDPAKWRTDVPIYNKVKYADIYPGVDLVYYGNQGRLEYDFVVAPGADPKTIGLSFESSTPLLDANGNLILAIQGAEVRFPKPVVYQLDKGARHSIEGHYVLMAGNQVGFELPSYDRSQPLVIDPTLVYSTYLGGSSNDASLGIAVDSSGNAYVTGGTVSTDFPTTTGVVQKNFGGTANCKGPDDFGCGDMFVTKMNSSGTALVWSTFLGGSDKEEGTNIVVDSSGNVYIAGSTHSANFPTTAGAFQKILKGTKDGTVTKLNSTGSALLYSTLLGGTAKETIFGLAVDSSGSAYVSGSTGSTDFPITAGVFQNTCKSCAAGSSGFVTKFNSTGSALVYSTFLGGSTASGDGSIAVDSSGNAYVAGFTLDADFPTLNPIQATFGGGGTSCDFNNGLICGDAYVTKLNSTGTALMYSTYLGGSGEDTAFGIAVDAAGNAYVAGGTDSTNFPTTPGVVQPTFGGGSSGCASTGIACGDVFITKINSAGSAFIYSTYLGGASDDLGGLFSLAVDSAHNVHIAGVTNSPNFPTTADASQINYGGGTASCPSGGFCGDGFLAQLNLNASALVFSTYHGGSADDAAVSAAVDTSGNTYTAGGTLSTNFPTTAGAFDTTCGTDGTCNGGLVDAFVAKFAIPLPGVTFAPTSLSFAGQLIGTTSASKAVTLTNSGTGTLSIPASAISASGDYSQTNNCPTTLNAGANCTITVTFKPSVSGSILGEITVNDSAPSAIQLVNLTGTGVTPLTFAPTTLAFGTVTVGTTSPGKTVTLTNNQNTTLNITFPASANYAAVGSGTKACGTTLAGKSTCTISVTFTPTANGSDNGAVTLTSNSTPATQLVTLSGTGSGGGTAPLTFSPATLTFSAQLVGTTSAAKTVTVSNASASSLNITGLAAPGTFTATPSGTTPCTGPLAAAQSCTFSVKFSPDAAGTFKVGVSIADNASITPQIYDVTGTAVLPVSFAPTSLTFAAQSVGTVSAAQTVTLTNNQSSTLNITSIAATGDYTATPGGPTPCGGSVAAKGKCTFVVTFSPTATGAIKGEATVTHNATSSPQVVNLTGTGQ